MANVMFKRGLQNNLPPIAANGTFYLTTDTNRLYVGVADNAAPVLLNQTVQFVSTLQELNTISSSWTDNTAKESHKRDLYYIENDNILATWNGSKWVQINPDDDTYIDRAELTAEASGENGVKVKYDIYNNTGDHEFTPISQDVTLNGANGVKISVSGKVITFTGDTYSLDKTVANNTATVTLKSANTDNDSSINIKGGSNVKVSQDADNNIVIASTDIYTQEVSLDVSNGKLKTTIGRTDDELIESNEQELYFTLGENGTKYGINTALPVYTQTEVNNLFKDLNGLKYIGTVGSSGEYPDLNVTDGITGLDLHNGDMLLVSGGSVTYGTNKTAKTGDLLIATGSENADGVLTSITWNYVPSGDDTVIDTTYSFITDTTDNSFTIENDLTNIGLVVKYTDGTAIDVVSEKSNDSSGSQSLNVTINHANVPHEDATGTALSGKDKFDAVTGVVVNEQGHVTKVTTTNIGISTYEPAPISVTAGSITGVSSVVLNSSISKNGEEIRSTDNNTTIQSNSLTLTATSSDVMTINLEWGSF